MEVPEMLEATPGPPLSPLPIPPAPPPPPAPQLATPQPKDPFVPPKPPALPFPLAPPYAPKLLVNTFVGVLPPPATTVPKLE